MRDHDHEVTEACWVGIDEAAAMLAFKNERDVLAKAHARLPGGPQSTRG